MVPAPLWTTTSLGETVITRIKNAVLGGMAALALTLSGCAAATDNGGSTNADSGEKGAVAMSFAGLDIQIWVDIIDLMRPQIEEAGYAFLTDDPQWNIQNQVNSWEGWIQRGDVRAIMGYPVQSDSIGPVTDQAVSAGIPVVGYATEWDGISGALLIDNYADGYELGSEAGKWIVDTYGAEQVPVMLYSYYETDLGIDRSEGIKDGLRDSGANVSVSESSALSIQDSMDAATSQLAAKPETKVWLGTGSDQIIGAYRTLMDRGVAPDDNSYLLGAVDATNESLDILKQENSIWRLGYILPAQDLADNCVELLLAAANGESVESVTLRSVRVTAANADEFYVR